MPKGVFVCAAPGKGQPDQLSPSKAQQLLSPHFFLNKWARNFKLSSASHGKTKLSHIRTSTFRNCVFLCLFQRSPWPPLSYMTLKVGGNRPKEPWRWSQAFLKMIFRKIFIGCLRAEKLISKQLILRVNYVTCKPQMSVLTQNSCIIFADALFICSELGFGFRHVPQLSETLQPVTVSAVATPGAMQWEIWQGLTGSWSSTGAGEIIS